MKSHKPICRCQINQECLYVLQPNISFGLPLYFSIHPSMISDLIYDMPIQIN